MFVSCPAARFHATSRRGTTCIYVYAYMDAICMRQRGHFQAARHFHALHACGSAALSRTMCMRQRGHFHCMYAAAWALSRTMCMRQRGTFTHYMHAAARALSLFHSQGSAAAPGHVGGDGLPDCTRVRVCWSLFEGRSVSCATASIVSAAVPAAASAAVPVAVSISLNRMRSHAHARGGAGGAGFSLCSSRFAAQTLEALLGGGLEGHRPRARAPGDPGHARTSLRQVHRDLSTSTSRRRGGPGDGTDRSLAGGRALLQGSTDARAAACT